MNPSLSPVELLLIKWTLLLALGWLAHWRLREKHSRWRLILWRSLLCFGLVLPLTSLVSFPVLHVPIFPSTAAAPETPEIFLAAAAGNSAPVVTPNLNSPAKPVAASATLKAITPSPLPVAVRAIRWKSLLLWLWIFGAAFAGLRLARLQWQLALIRQASRAGESALENRARELQTGLGMKRAVSVRVSDAVTSPFACGLWRPTIMLPKNLLAALPSGEISALLAHEIAHFRRHDLFWCVGWRWMQAAFWFHPLVWKIPAAHNLACEQEADRMAAGQLADRAAYPQLLARLALRVLALPAVETRLVLNGGSQIAQRLKHLQKENAGAWRWHHSLAGFALAGLLFLVAAGCEFSKSNSAAAAFPSAGEFKKVLIVVQDTDGQPIAGATIKPYGFRVQGVRHVDAYGWYLKQFGSPDIFTTDSEGRAWVNYSVVAIPEEKLLTGELNFTVSHPDYCSWSEGIPVDGTGKPIRLVRGIVLELTAHYGKERLPATDFIPQGVVRAEDWHTNGNDGYVVRGMTAGGHLVQLTGRLASGEIVFSDAVEFTAEPGKTNRLDVEMISGIRIEGRLDDNVPRPVKNGRVVIAVRPRQIPAYLVPEDTDAIWKRIGRFQAWRTDRPIAEDGTFVFESVPPGEVDVIVQGDGFVSKSIGQVRNRINGQLYGNAHDIVIPQPFPLTAPLTKIEVITEPTATLELTAKTKWGSPIEGATVYLSPNAMRMGGIFGVLMTSSEKPFRMLAPLPKLDYSGKTDRFGKVVLKNFPAETFALGVVHPQYVIPLQEPHGLPNRQVSAHFSPGVTNVLTVTMQPVGKDFIGTAK